MADNFQRIGAISNAHVGRDFESAAMEAFAVMGIHVERDHSVAVGIGAQKKRHSFDLGSEVPPVLIECKSHRWTSGSNVPSAKLTVWNEAMYYFHCAPSNYRKILCVLHDIRPSSHESLARYYIRSYVHLIPNDVEIWEFIPELGECRLLYSYGEESKAVPVIQPSLSNHLDTTKEVLNMRSETKTATADEIRAFVNKAFVAPARANKKTSITIFAGDVHKDMGLKSRMPAVCSALDAKKFQDQYSISISRREGPLQGSTASWLFSI